MNNFLLNLCVGGCCFCVAFISGIFVTSDYYEKEIAQYVAKAQEEKAKALADVSQKERSVSQKLTKAYSEQVKQKDEIQRRFDIYVRDLSANDGVRNQGSRDTDSVSDNSRTPTRPQPTTTDRCNAKDLRAVKANLMELAKQHDELAVKYNSLLEFYNTVRLGYQ